MEPLKLKACDTEYFDHYFYEMDSSQAESIGKLIPFFFCIEEPDDLKVSGTLSEMFYTTPAFLISRCNPRIQECKSEEKFRNFIENLLIATIYNT